MMMMSFSSGAHKQIGRYICLFCQIQTTDNDDDGGDDDFIKPTTNARTQTKNSKKCDMGKIGSRISYWVIDGKCLIMVSLDKHFKMILVACMQFVNNCNNKNFSRTDVENIASNQREMFACSKVPLKTSTLF